MAIYHASLKAVQRSAGRSATAAAAYRAACVIVDARTGERHDYSKKRGVLHAELRLPGGQAPDREQWWNSVELHHKRGDAVVARELVVALPVELDQDRQIYLARKMAAALAKQYSVAVDVCVHEPSKDGDDRNTHAHILMTGCTVNQAGELGKKCEALDPIHCARKKIPTAAEWVRPIWEKLANEALADAGQDARIDHRSNADRGIADAPTQHHGPAVTDMIRNAKSDDSDVLRRQADAAAAAAVELLERQLIDARAAADRLQMQADDAAAELAIEARIAQQEQEQEQDKKLKEKARQQALADAIARHTKIDAEIDRAMADRQIAMRRMQAAAIAQRTAEAEQREAGQSLLKTALSIARIKEWKKIEEAYHRAVEIYHRIENRLTQLRESLSDAWEQIIAIDPSIEQRRAELQRLKIEQMQAAQAQINLQAKKLSKDIQFETNIQFEANNGNLHQNATNGPGNGHLDIDSEDDDDDDDSAELPAPMG